jgi:hypothetical protein
MPYIRLDQIEFSIGTQVLLDKVNLRWTRASGWGCWAATARANRR